MKRMAGCVALIAAMLLGPGARDRASALDGRSFTASAEAATVNFQYGIPGFILTDKFIDHGGPTAQSRFESVGGKRAQAQFPYIGYQADYPGLYATVAAQFTATPPQLPSYPFRAAADSDGQSEQVIGQESAPYFVKAKASAEETSSIARFGAPPGSDGASAPSSLAKTEIIDRPDGVTVIAETVAQSFSLGPLSVTDMRAKSTSSYTSGAADVVTKTETFVKGVAAGTMAFSFGPDGLKVAQNGVPVPAEQGLASLNQALAPAGFEIHFASSRTLPGGAASAAFEIVQKHPVPGGGDGREGIFRIRFGGVISQISLGS